MTNTPFIPTPASSKDPYLFRHEEYKGVSIYSNKLDWAPCVHIRFGFFVGAVDDPIGKEGLSHFLEHLPFNGSKAFPDIEAVKQFSKDFLLDSFNARTSSNSTMYQCRALPEHATEAIRGMADICFNPLLTDADIERERSIITQEAWGRLRNQKYINHLRREIGSIYQNHPAGRFYSPLGWPETIAATTAEDLRSWHKKQYHRGNLCVVLVGAVTDSQIETVKQAIDLMPEGTRLPDLTPPTSWPTPTEARIEVTSADIGIPSEQATIYYSRILPTNHHTLAVGNITRAFLHEILFTELREKRGLLYGLSADISINKDITEHSIYIDLGDDKIPEAEAAVRVEIDKILSGTYANIFEKEKKLRIDRIKAAEFNSGSVANDAFSDIEYFDHPITLAENLREAEAVTHEDAVSLIREVLNPETLYRGIIRASK
jgi:predicted Zn-dependent peptidase